MWLSAQMRQPTRPTYSDVKETTFTKFLDELLCEKNFLLEREVAGSKMIVPNRAHCLEYEFQLRKEVLKLVREEGQSIEKALWSAYNNPQNRIEHWLTLLTIANSGATNMKVLSSSSSNPADQRLQKNREEIRRPRKVNATIKIPAHVKSKALSAPQDQLTLPARQKVTAARVNLEYNRQ